ncbi:MAG: response regulator [Leptolyngbyaceae cyanobacterium MAG.088]|nr:response regulator [Leptolyngbyaceae cyanobacterium MAG.088]
MKILIVEDDAGLAEVLEQTLSKQQHYQVEMATDGEAGWDLIELYEYDLVLLDLHLPKLDGISFCRQLRAAGKTVPVLLMTAENTQASKIAGLDAGADDYVLKPLNLSELLARIRALLRRGKSSSSPLLIWGSVTLNPSSCEVCCQGQRLNLTSKEYLLLELLLRYQNRIFSLNSLMERLWTFEKMPSENAVRTHVKSLRRKLRLAGADDMIETVYGLGYRLKPQPVTLPPSTQAEVSPSTAKATAPALGGRSALSEGSRDQVLTPLKDIWERHQPKYLALIDALEQAVIRLQNEDVNSAFSLAQSQLELSKAQKGAHKLKGALGSFGFITASNIAAHIEQLLSVTPLPEREHIQQLPDLIQQLRQCLHPSTTIPFNGSTAPKESDTLSYQWLIIDPDSTLVEELIHEASIWGIQPRVATTIDAAKKILKQYVIDIVMMDINCTANVDDGVTFLSELTQQQPSLQVVVATHKDSFNERINVLRAGAGAFLQKPVTAPQVLETITQNLESTKLFSARILALDDDPAILACLKKLLMPWGFQLMLVSNPMEFWDCLEQSPPDLMILDIEMPDFNGLELCQVIRNDPSLHQFPILFLSAHTAPDIICRVFDVGADDYLSKPIIGPELVARILNRLERVRLMRTLAEVDSLTGLSRRHQSAQELNRLLKLADRQQTTLCFAMLDLDRFKQVNDSYGHAIGDQVLKTFGDYLNRTFRGEDVLARWGGEEFVVGLFGISKELAVQRLNAFLQLFNQHVFLGDEKCLFHVSFSGGIAEYPQDGMDIQTLYKTADKALFRAKAGGRNQIVAS